VCITSILQTWDEGNSNDFYDDNLIIDMFFYLLKLFLNVFEGQWSISGGGLIVRTQPVGSTVCFMD
jgi:hypothetical protein